MISSLQVHGVGGIKDAGLDFTGSFIVITGESGSGKSSLVRALEFISGKRAQVNYIHASEEYSEVNMNYEPKNVSAYEGIVPLNPASNELNVLRRFKKDGRGTLSLSGTNLTVNKLSELMEQEIVIQSQYAQLSLLEPLRQLELVDSCGGSELARVKGELAGIFEQALKTETALVELKNSRKERAERFSDAEKDVALINSLKLTADSENKLEADLKELDEQSAKLKTLYALYGKIAGNENGACILDSATEICRGLQELENADSPKREAAEQLLSAAQKLSALFEHDMKLVLDKGSVEEARDETEEKLGQLRRLKRRLKAESCEDILNYALEAQQTVVWLQTSLSELQKLETESAQLRKNLVAKVQALRKMRKAAAEKLQNSVNDCLNELAMGYARFEIEIAELDKVKSNGAESARFMLRLPDQEPMPVSKTASGGELSRILIALQLAAGDDKLPGTLVFDEVEAGLGGKSALLAGYKLKELSRRCRTILITHQATIASMADQHFLVKRDGDDTLIFPVSGAEREKEIARMLSGDENSTEALTHARALLQTETD